MLRLELHGVDVNLEDGKEFKNVNYESENIEVLHLGTILCYIYSIGNEDRLVCL